MPKYALALDLKNDPQLIAQYEAHHQSVWPEVIESIKASGITACDIYRVENRLVMIIETTPDFDFQAKALADSQNPRVQAWEKLMWDYQQAIPSAKPGEKWVLMKPIFSM